MIQQSSRYVPQCMALQVCSGIDSTIDSFFDLSLNDCPYTQIHHNMKGIKKRTSQIYEVKEEEGRSAMDKNQSEVKQASVQSDAGLAMSIARRNRISNGMQSSLKFSKLKSIDAVASMKRKASNKSVEQEQVVGKSKLGSMFKSKFKDLRKIVECGMCAEEIKLSEKTLKLCTCDHNHFCESCLHHYVIYKVKNFQEVLCPEEECNAPVDTNGNLFKGLPIDIQKNFKKAQRFFETAKDPNSKLCPKEECEGVIRLTPDQVMVCDTCESEYCSKCLLTFHEGDCDSKEVEFFEHNLHFRQCKRCKFVIEKNQGCNHMTCRCGYQFCYVCGADWKPAHYGDHDENGNLIEHQPGVAPAVNYGNDNIECCDCGCMDDCLGECCANVVKAPFKFLLFLLWSVLMLLLFCVKDLIIIIGITLMTIFAGMFAFSCEILSECEDFGACLGIIFFPFLMIAGVGVAFGEIWCEAIPDVLGETCQMYCSGIEGICQI